MSVPRGVDALRYQPQADDPPTPPSEFDDELLYVKVRYKDPDGSTSKLLDHAVADDVESPSTDFRFATAVAGFGMLLRDSEHAGDFTLDDVIRAGREGTGRRPARVSWRVHPARRGDAGPWVAQGRGAKAWERR